MEHGPEQEMQARGGSPTQAPEEYNVLVLGAMQRSANITSFLNGHQQAMQMRQLNSNLSSINRSLQQLRPYY
jgi:hypothetical protein